jgi:hypothetical protein
MILATDLGVAKEFYGDRVGLDVPARCSKDCRRQAGITTALAVPLMTWVVMPGVTGCCAGGCIPITALHPRRSRATPRPRTPRSQGQKQMPDHRIGTLR